MLVDVLGNEVIPLLFYPVPVLSCVCAAVSRFLCRL
jgi:hypothetical protein